MQNISVCEKYVWNDKEYTSSGRYMHDTLSANGCDSLTILDLKFIQNPSKLYLIPHVHRTNWNGNVYTNSGTYTYQGQTDHSCDSIIILNLTIQAADTIIQNNESLRQYNWNGNVYTNSGTYTFNGQNENGCDSIVFLNLSIDTILYSNEFISSCDQYVGTENHTTQQVSTEIHFLLSMVVTASWLWILHWTKVNPSFKHRQHAIHSYGWERIIKKADYIMIPWEQPKGCDSIIKLDLTIHSTKSIKQQKPPVILSNGMALHTNNPAFIFQKSITAFLWQYYRTGIDHPSKYADDPHAFCMRFIRME